MRSVRGGRGTPIPSPNIWHWPDVYEVENKAQDADGALWAAMSAAVDWTGGDVVDIGCGAGFHLPEFARTARHVIGVEPHPPLVSAARRRTRGSRNVDVVQGTAESTGLDASSVDLVHARTAYFFGKGSGPGIREAMRVLRPGGTLLVVDLDVSASPYGDWMRADLAHYDAAAVESYFDAQGFTLVRVDSRWEFESRADLRQVLGIEFTRKTAERAFGQISGLAFTVRYRIHTRVKPHTLELG
ncbi:SAM-dependent methyltransferase [Rhodococcus sp. 27YEA15]|uniref:class I SAM-dependent methyltransferase n=1 Tax=Rhodococcus sp. 27YEA15 TaxID=3156259 RepID=UPI003C7CB603